MTSNPIDRQPLAATRHYIPHFGTGGWRELIGQGFDRANVELVGTALARKMKREQVAELGVVIGFDRRFLSDEAARWLACVLAGSDIPVRLITRQAPTPLVMFTVARHGLPYGLSVTASHNPALYNGIKVFTAGGRDADEACTHSLEQDIHYVAEHLDEFPGTITYADGLASGMIEEINPFNDYIDSILLQIDTQAIRRGELYVVLDPMYGVSRTSLQTILMSSRCTVDVIHENHDALFGGRLPAPEKSTLGALSSYVVQHKADIGIATDGDADRLGIIDDEGDYVHPNQLLVLLYWYLHERRGWKGAVVRNVATTSMLDKLAARFGETCYEVPVGFKWISAKMQETDAIIGGESSGGLTVRGHIKGKDGIYAGSLLVEMLAVEGRKLSDIYRGITADFGPHYMTEHSYRFDPARKAEIESIIKSDHVPDFGFKVARTSRLDGCKHWFENGGWIIARFSGTEPLLRIFCEMPDEAAAERATDAWRSDLGI